MMTTPQSYKDELAISAKLEIIRTLMPSGWQLVPKKATDKMLAQLFRGYTTREQAWSAALTVAPQPPVAQTEALSDAILRAKAFDEIAEIENGKSVVQPITEQEIDQATKKAMRELSKRLRAVIAQPTRERPSLQPLSDEQITHLYNDGDAYHHIAFARLIERAHGIDSTCRKCGGDMRPGKYTEQTAKQGMTDFIGNPPGMSGCTMSPGGPGALADCMKCTLCGWSMT